MNRTINDDRAISPQIGRRLLPVELDRVAKTDPERAYFSRPRNSTNLADGFEDISYRRVANAVNRTAHWLQTGLGKPDNFDTIAYLAAPDIRNVLLTVAVSKVGYKASSLSQEALIGHFLTRGSSCSFLPEIAFKAMSISSN